MVTLSWPITDRIRDNRQIDSVADFVNSLETPNGVKVPVVLRLRKQQSADLWRKVVRRFREKNVVNALYAYSVKTDSVIDEKTYLQEYLGDDVIDVMGLENYCQAEEDNVPQLADFTKQLDQNLGVVCRIAKKHQKAVAVTETVYKCIAYK